MSLQVCFWYHGIPAGIPCGIPGNTAGIPRYSRGISTNFGYRGNTGNTALYSRGIPGIPAVFPGIPRYSQNVGIPAVFPSWEYRGISGNTGNTVRYSRYSRSIQNSLKYHGNTAVFPGIPRGIPAVFPGIPWYQKQTCRDIQLLWQKMFYVCSRML